MMLFDTDAWYDTVSWSDQNGNELILLKACMQQNNLH